MESFVKINIKSNHDLYTTLNNTRNNPQLVEVVDMINTGTFPPDARKQKQNKCKKKSDKETVGAIIEVCEESSPADTLPVEYEPTDSEDSDSEDSDSLDASVSSTGEESHTSSKLEEASEAR